jgi:mannosyltransferase
LLAVPEPSTVTEPGTATQAGVDEIPSGSTGRWLDRIGLVAIVALGVALRFIARSPLWLDEALSVNIARLPLGRIGPWLRHDGHPPLYYWLLHGWTALFGTGDTAVRSLSGVFGLALLPLVWIAANRIGGRRAAWAALTLTAVSPYAVRYSTEARMYALVMVLALAGWLLGSDALERPTWWRLGGVAALSGLLLWTHYWAMWFLGAVGLALLVRLWRARRGGRHAEAAATIKVAGAIVVGGLLFLPWVGSLLYQSAHTGTPWAKPSLPTEVVATSVADFGGGPKGDNLVLGWSLVGLVALGLFGRARSRCSIELDLGTRPEARRPALVIVGTLLLATAAMLATSSAFATRYDAVWFPLFVVLAGLGISRFAGPGFRRTALAFVLLLGVVGSVRTSFTHTRSQARDAAQAIAANGRPGDVVVTCPDQLGPSLARGLPAGFTVGTYPNFAPPQFVDWVDYTKRLESASPARTAADVARRAEGHNLFLVWAGTYRTHKQVCEQLVNELAGRRPGLRVVLPDNGGDFEHESVLLYPASASPAGTAH